MLPSAVLLKSQRFRWLAATFVLVVLGVTLQRYGLNARKSGEHYYPQYNNYLIFKHSWNHLSHGDSLYVLYPGEHFDFFKYTPTFAVWMAPFATLPDWAGLSVWNLLNALVLFWALSRLTAHRIARLPAWIIGILVMIEWITSLQNTQSNGLIAGLIVLSVVWMEERRLVWASLLLVSAAFIKPFALAAGVLFMFYPQRWKAVLWSGAWMAVLFVLPLLVVSWNGLIGQYSDWIALLEKDRGNIYGLSIAGIFKKWFGVGGIGNEILAVGAVLLLAPLVQVRRFHEETFRLQYLSLVLLWVIVFNHMSESPTYIIALAGVWLWWFSRPQRQHWMWTFIGLTAVLSVLSPTDLFPRSIRDNYVVPYVLKALPIVLIFAQLSLEMWRGASARRNRLDTAGRQP